MKRISKILITIGVLLLTISFSLTAYYIIINKQAEKESKENIEKINQELIIEDIEREYITIDGKNYIGILKYQKESIALPIASEYTKSNLNHSVVVYSGSIKENNLVICAHNLRSLFAFLHRLAVKDQITIVDANNNEHVYEVCEVEVLEPTEISEMIKSKYDLTLFTCTYSGKTRLAVRLNKIN